MESWFGGLIGLVTGIIATLIADNQYVRFNLEKGLRKLLGKPLISATLSGFRDQCSNGMFLIYCIELKNKMWLTQQIPKVYLLSEGAIDYDSHAYKPLVYFRSRGISDDKTNLTLEQLLEEYGSKIIAYTPDNSDLGLNLSRKMPYRVAILCELVKKDNTKEPQPLNSFKVVGELRLPVANPMPKTTPGAWWNMRVISEVFGLIDIFHISIPKDLNERQPLGNSGEVYKMKDRPPCLLDLGYLDSLTWRLRFDVNNCEIIVKSGYPKKILIKKPKKKIKRIGIKRNLKKQRIDINRGINIQ